MNITYNSMNGKFFYEMQKDELLKAVDVIANQIDSQTKSISGICISDQERLLELWRAYQNCNFNLNKF